MHLVLGSYDGSLVGLQVAAAQSDSLVSRRRFAYTPHSSCVKALASCGHTLVSTGTDERVLVYDLKRRSEYGTLVQHEGTVTCAEIWGGTHLLTGSEDKTVIVWRTKDWVSLSTLRGHKEKLSALAVHPSGKLSLVSDVAGTVYLWNLTSAKCVFRHRTAESSVLRWSPDGQAYASVHNDKVEVSTTGAETLCTLAPKGKDGHSGSGRVFDVAFVDDNVLLTGGEDRKLSAWDLRTGSSESAAEGTSRVATQPKESSAAFSSRVKAIKTFEVGGAKYCAAASAQGSVSVYDLRQFGAEPVMTYDTRSRLTCMEAVATFEGEDEDDSDGTYDFEQSASHTGSRANDDERSNSSSKRRKR